MTYKNALAVLPQELLALVQEYAGGELLYIPAPQERRKAWGENTGSRNAVRQRNLAIREAFRKGTALELLAKEYFLSPETVKKIVYSKQ